MEAGARKLSTHQKAVLIQVLLTFPEQRVNVCYQREASDAFDYAQDFLTIFKVIGWDVKESVPAENWTSERRDYRWWWRTGKLAAGGGGAAGCFADLWD